MGVVRGQTLDLASRRLGEARKRGAKRISESDAAGEGTAGG